MTLDHIGIVVPRLEAALDQWERLFGYQLNSDPIVNTRQKVKVAFLSKPGSLTIKLIEPAGVDSPVFQFARKGGGLHHLCFRCSDLAVELSRMDGLGAKLIVPPEPGEAFNNHDIAFLLAGSGLNVEMIDTAEKRGWRAETCPARLEPTASEC